LFAAQWHQGAHKDRVRGLFSRHSFLDVIKAFLKQLKSGILEFPEIILLTDLEAIAVEFLETVEQPSWILEGFFAFDHSSEQFLELFDHCQ